jgi:hypothetical protein
VTTHLNQEIHRALHMVKGRDGKSQLHVCLVQDYGRPDDPDASAPSRNTSRNGSSATLDPGRAKRTNVSLTMVYHFG